MYFVYINGIILLHLDVFCVCVFWGYAVVWYVLFLITF